MPKEPADAAAWPRCSGCGRQLLHGTRCTAAHLHVLLAIIVIVNAMRNHLASSPICAFLAIATYGCACKVRLPAQPQLLACKGTSCPLIADCCSTVDCLYMSYTNPQPGQSAEAICVSTRPVGHHEGGLAAHERVTTWMGPAQYIQAGAPIQSGHTDCSCYSRGADTTYPELLSARTATNAG